MYNGLLKIDHLYLYILATFITSTRVRLKSDYCLNDVLGIDARKSGSVALSITLKRLEASQS